MNENITLSPQLRDWMDSIDANTTPKVLAKDMSGLSPTLRDWMICVENDYTQTPAGQMRAVEYEGVPFEMRTWMTTNQPEVDVTNVMVPTTASVQLDGTVQFNVTGAHGDLTWSVSGGATKGSTTQGGLFTAPALLPTPASATINAADEETPTAETVTGAITLVAKLVISPTTATVAQGATQQFTSTGGYGTKVWSVAGDGEGTITQLGLYTAGSSSASDIVRVTDSQTTPVAANAAVTVPTLGTMATPTFSPVAGSYGPTQNVTISATGSPDSIHYTTNGSTPTSGSPTYSTPIEVDATKTLKAIAIKANYTDSAIGSALFTINGACGTPTFDPVAGTYTSIQNATISSTTAGSSIYYTVDGSTPDSGDTLYSTPVEVGVSETLKAIAIKANYSDSGIGSAAYVINLELDAWVPTVWSLGIGVPVDGTSLKIESPAANGTLLKKQYWWNIGGQASAPSAAQGYTLIEVADTWDEATGFTTLSNANSKLVGAQIATEEANGKMNIYPGASAGLVDVDTGIDMAIDQVGVDGDGTVEITSLAVTGGPSFGYGCLFHSVDNVGAITDYQMWISITGSEEPPTPEQGYTLVKIDFSIMDSMTAFNALLGGDTYLIAEGQTQLYLVNAYGGSVTNSVAVGDTFTVSTVRQGA